MNIGILQACLMALQIITIVVGVIWSIATFNATTRGAIVRIDKMDKALEDLSSNVSKLTGSFDRIIGKLEVIEVRIAANEKRISSIEATNARTNGSL